MRESIDSWIDIGRWVLLAAYLIIAVGFVRAYRRTGARNAAEIVRAFVVCMLGLASLTAGQLKPVEGTVWETIFPVVAALAIGMSWIWLRRIQRKDRAV